MPHFDGLTLDTMMYHAKKNVHVMRALPSEPREIDKLPHLYISNVIYTIVGDKFKEWVEKVIAERTEKIVKEQDMAIEMDAEVLAAFHASNRISGKYHIKLI